MGLFPGRAWLPAMALALACGSGSGAGASADASAGDSAAGGDGSADGALEAASTADSGADAGDDSGQDSGQESGDDSGPDSGDDADTGIPPLVCTGEAYEPNDTEVTATPLAGIDDCDSSGSTISAVSSGTGDADWIHYFGTDTTGCTVDPTAQIDAAGLRACIFIICPTGVTTITGCTNGSPDMSQAGTPGCCTTSTAAMTVQMTCSGTITSDSADVYMRVDQPSSNQCVPYDLAYHF